MKALLTSAGIKNAAIAEAMVNLLGKPIAECSALCIPTAAYGHPLHPFVGWRFIAGRSPNTPMCELGWKSLGVLELSVLPSIGEEQWVPLVKETDILLVGGGDALFLAHWMRESGLAKLLPSLHDTVYVGLSAGSMVLTPCIGEDFMFWKPPTGGDQALGIVDFSIFPHVDHPDLSENTMAAAEKWAAALPNPAYAIDDDTAIRVVDRRGRPRHRGPLEALPALRCRPGSGAASRLVQCRGPVSSGMTPDKSSPSGPGATPSCRRAVW